VPLSDLTPIVRATHPGHDYVPNDSHGPTITDSPPVLSARPPLSDRTCPRSKLPQSSKCPARHHPAREWNHRTVLICWAAGLDPKVRRARKIGNAPSFHSGTHFQTAFFGVPEPSILTAVRTDRLPRGPRNELRCDPGRGCPDPRRIRRTALFVIPIASGNCAVERILPSRRSTHQSGLHS
jgi:hypothetical protein